ncbi:MAG: epoxide hydrolase family protein [Steroidobacteraceae bacterium]
MHIEPFSVRVSDAVLDDLKLRLQRTRLAPDFANDEWQYGTNGAYLQELMTHWRDDYDWRQHERAMNQFPHFRTVIDDVPIHFIHVRGKGPKPLPLMLNHGWPWTFWDFRKVIGPLSDPAAHGGDPADAFDVVVPSLPGYGFSTPLKKPGLNPWTTADLWVKLMAGLGYPKFATHGGDWGAMVSAQLGHKYADRLFGAHITLMVPLDYFGGAGVPPEDYAPHELPWLERAQAFFQSETGYGAVQMTKPQSLAYGLNDSPAGLCAWILEKRRTWSDCRGNVESRFSKDDLITTMMLYWITESFGTSARFYYETAHNLWQPVHPRMPVVEAPTGVAVFLNEVILQPKRWAQRYYNLQRWTEFPSGGHFAPMEEPDVLIGDIRAFFRSLRP